ncbi:nucleoside-diphosphate sugar epimerase/dehydratase [Pusillimonas sp. ANT_WB101]|uniref:polysaccharide biosynthesis protein n=1 Tax=Pusillimonas sp. ANT_WB101 TaxID=2597356 RepID=UPI0011EE676C|nr:nucleoside-diphosphate sugar epimerase/dehydratase [Pusillimonas sp. ANT_WB101]KAA0911331.1 polysaccharide biosynthesis protein [Pusillimonas sp. ANT_WB101]
MQLENRPQLNTRERLLALPRSQKRLLQLVADTVLIWLALWLAFAIRLDSLSAAAPFGGHAWLFITAPLVSLPLFIRFGMYRAVLRYVGAQALTTIGRVVTLSVVILAAAVYLHGTEQAVVPRSLLIIYWLLCLLFVGGLRLVIRRYFNQLQFGSRHLPLMPHGPGKRHDQRQRVLIYGAGEAGSQLLQALRHSSERLPVAFLDDNPQLTDRLMAGMQIYAPDNLAEVLEDTGAQEILLAIPRATRARRREIVEMLAPYSVPVRTVPGLSDLASGRVKVEYLREVEVEDLLGRDPVPPHDDLLARCISEQTVMVTGAGGSIGSELCRQILRICPSSLILYEHSEFGLYAIHQELESYARDNSLPVSVIPVLGSVRNQTRMLDVMNAWKVDTVYHAAAYKHVPMVESNIAEGIVNNTFGTLYAAQAAIRAGVANFVLISTDKAVRPTNIMGATKRMAELVLQGLAQEATPTLYGFEEPTENRTRFTMVRFGNVLGSSGSVIPLFRKQIRSGGPVTVTHPEITRYFMTIPEAAQLVIQAGSMGEGGDVFVLDMGEPVKIAQLAEKMIQLSGLSVRSARNIDGDIEVEFTGLRPGEKLYEELLIGDNVTPTAHQMIMRANEKRFDWDDLIAALTQLQAAIKAEDYPRIRQLFLMLVDGYKGGEHIEDAIYKQKIVDASRTAQASEHDAQAYGVEQRENGAVSNDILNTQSDLLNGTQSNMSSQGERSTARDTAFDLTPNTP